MLETTRGNKPGLLLHTCMYCAQLLRSRLSWPCFRSMHERVNDPSTWAKLRRSREVMALAFLFVFLSLVPIIRLVPQKSLNACVEPLRIDLLWILQFVSKVVFCRNLSTNSCHRGVPSCSTNIGARWAHDMIVPTCPPLHCHYWANQTFPSSGGLHMADCRCR